MKEKTTQNQNLKKVKKSTLPAQSRRRGTRYVWLNVLPDNLFFKVPQGKTIWKALEKTEIDLGGECDGLGKCGKCKVKVLSMISPPTKEERELLDEEELEQGIRLACYTKINQDLVISTGISDAEVEYSQILTTSHILPSNHVTVLKHEPLVNKRLITLSSEFQNEGISDLDRIKLGLGPEYQGLEAPLNCLRTLSRMLESTNFSGTAVLSDDCLMAWQNSEKINNNCGLVFDIGTSTLVGKLINLLDGSEVAVASCLNSQSRLGSDVISRLQYVIEHQDGLKRLNRLLIKDMHQLIACLLETASLQPDDIFVAVAAGNTTMQHFLLGLPTNGIAEAPFSPVLTDGMIVRAADIGLQLHPSAILYTMPMKSGYIGGDLISDILTSGVAEQEDEIILGLDLGTNGEIFLGNSKKMMTCSAAAGPALEGARISDGMIARAGAIEGVSFEEGDLHYLVVGNIKPMGICGSGLVELIAVLLRLGIIDHEGLIRPTRKKGARGLNSRLVNRSGVYDFLVASAEESYNNNPVYLTQKDVRELQLAKGAIASGIKILVEEMGIRVGDIDRIYLAGALGNYVNPYSAMRIGLIPRIDLENIRSLGNAASMGASMVLVSGSYWQRAKDITEFIEHVELSSHPGFDKYFIDQIDFPRGYESDIYRDDVDYEVMGKIKVGDLMATSFRTVSSTTDLDEMANMLRDTGYRGFPVLDENGRLFGIVTLADLDNSSQSGITGLTVGDIATREIFVSYADESLSDVLRAIPKSYGRIPVVNRNDRRHLVGVLRRRDIITAYRRKLAQIKKGKKSRAKR